MLSGDDNKWFGSLEDELENKTKLGAKNYPKMTDFLVRILNIYHTVKSPSKILKTTEDVTFE